MTLESWSMGIVRPVMERYPSAWVFFVTFIVEVQRLGARLDREGEARPQARAASDEIGG